MKNIYKNIYSILLYGVAVAVCLGALSAQAQQPPQPSLEQQKGVVYNAHFQPIEGVYVFSATDSAYTNALGGFALMAATADSLRFSHVSYQSLCVAASGLPERSLKVILQAWVQPLEEFVLRGLRVGENQRPWVGTFLSRKALDQQLIGEDLPFVLQRLTPSLVVNSEAGSGFSNYGALRLRGIGQENIALTLDGIPLGDMLDHGFYFSNFIDLASSVSGVQVVRGIGAVHHAVSGYGGAIHLRSPQLFESPDYIETQATGGSFGSGKASVLAQLSGKNVAGHVRLSYLQSDGWRQHSGTQGWSMFSALGWRKKQHLIKLLFFTGQTHNELAYTPESTAALEQTPRLNSRPIHEVDRFNQSLVAVAHHMDLTPYQWGYTLYFGHTEGSFPFGFQSEDTYTELHYGLRNVRVGGFVHMDWKQQAHQVRVGVHGYGFFRTNNEALAPAVRTHTYADGTRKFEGSILGRYTFSRSRWHVEVGGQVRFLGIAFDLSDHSFVDENGNALAFEEEVAGLPLWSYAFFNPQVSGAYLLQEVELFGRVGITNREPTRLDIVGDTNLNPGTLASVQRQDVPQYEQAVELVLGVRKASKGTSTTRYPWQASVNGFYLHVSDEIAPIGAFVPSYFAQLRKNIPQTQRWGIEYSGFLQLHPRVQVHTHGTWMGSHITEYSPDQGPAFSDVPISLTPSFTGALRTQVQLHGPWFAWGAVQGQTSSWVSPIAISRTRLPGYAVVDLGATFHRGQWHVDARVRNLFNKRYAVFGNQVDGQLHVLPQAGTSFWVSVKWRWEATK